MNKLAIFVIFMLLSFRSFSQNLPPIGAKWYYANGNKIYTQVARKDTLYEGKMCRKLMMDSIPYLTYEYSKKLYIYEEDSAMYFYNDFVKKFQKLYDFKQKIGNTWYYNYDYNIENDNLVDTIKIKVNSIETIYINGQKILKYYYIQAASIYFKRQICHLGTLNNDTAPGNNFLSKIGFNDFFIFTEKVFLYAANDFIPCHTDKFLNGSYTELVCYEDSELGLYKSSYRIKNCNPLELNPFTFTGINSQSLTQSINIFPNPTTGIFTISTTTNEPLTITVSNIMGYEVYQAPLNLSTLEIDLAQKPKGIYFVKVSTQGKIAAYYKLVVQ